MNQYKGFDENIMLTGKIALVTGCASGIGLAIAQMMARKGAKVVMVDINPKVNETAAEVEGAVPVVLDLTDFDACGEAVEKITKEVGYIDILCNVAGVSANHPMEEMNKPDWDFVINCNMNSVFNLSHHVGKKMIEAGKGGRIISMSSQAGIVALNEHVSYAASKGGLMAIARNMAVEWGKYGITSNTIAPTVVMTPMAKAYWVGEKAEKHLAQIPVGRFAEMDEVAILACFLASDAAAMINGANIVIDGGFTIG